MISGCLVKAGIVAVVSIDLLLAEKGCLACELWAVGVKSCGKYVLLAGGFSLANEYLLTSEFNTWFETGKFDLVGKAWGLDIK